MSLADALAGAAKTPCEQFVCKMRYRCSEQLLCCDSFRWYVKTGKAVSPYTKLEKLGKTTEVDAIDATREKYWQMAEDET
jgi:hypothetical protein